MCNNRVIIEQLNTVNFQQNIPIAIFDKTNIFRCFIVFVEYFRHNKYFVD